TPPAGTSSPITGHPPSTAMARAAARPRRLELAERWRGIQEDEEAEDGGEPSAAKHRRLIRAKEEWYGVYALLFFKSCKARAIGLRLARSMGKLR
uniref:Uncharacterized protein n=1 Tax=Setaria italica TaxID=4555 RepID=K4A1H9_SETIT